jgi:hypothetical protein
VEQLTPQDLMLLVVQSILGVEQAVLYLTLAVLALPPILFGAVVLWWKMFLRDFQRLERGGYLKRDR